MEEYLTEELFMDLIVWFNGIKQVIVPPGDTGK